jgi:hypothetical protein
VARPSIAIVVAYFGPAPFWLPAFFLSCRRNPDVQWLIYTDFEAPPAVPPNVTLKPMRLDELSSLVSGAVGTRVEVSRPRKICDLRITFGVALAGDLRPFDFWAYSDIDIVWGDLRRFMTDDLLNAHDILSSRKNRLSGHFTLFRNTPAINRAFEHIPDVAVAMTNAEYLHLDEKQLTHALKARSDSASGDVPRLYWRDGLTMDSAYQMALGDRDRLWWREGRTFDASGRELMYLHFHKLKKHMTTINFGFGDTPAEFAIDRSGIWA